MTGVGWPEFLPDGRHFLYVALAQRTEDSKLMVGSLDSKEAKPLFKTTSRVQYVPPGYLLYVREQSLVAQAFDLASLATKGEAVPLAEGLGTDAVGLAHFSGSLSGVLAYRAGETRNRQLVWVDRNGKELGAVGDTGEYGDLWPSPDGKRLVFDMPEGGSDGRTSGSATWPGRHVAIHVRCRQRQHPRLVAGRAPDRFHLRPQGRRRPVRERRLGRPARRRCFWPRKKKSSRPIGRATERTSSSTAVGRKRVGTSGPSP